MSRSDENPYQSPQASSDDAPPPLNAVLPACIAAGTAFLASFMVFTGIAVVLAFLLPDNSLDWNVARLIEIAVCLFLSLGTAALVGRYDYRQRVRTHERLMRLYEERERLAAELDRRRAEAED